MSREQRLAACERRMERITCLERRERDLPPARRAAIKRLRLELEEIERREALDLLREMVIEAGLAD